MRHVIFLLLLASPAWPDCPEPPDRSSEVDAILSEVQEATTEMDARQIFNGVWEIWTKAPDARAQDLLDQGMERREAYDFEAAVAAFDKLVAYCPDYAEGYNQRAFVNFIRQDYGTALDDLERALERNPRHVAAMSGKALTLMQLGRNKAAQGVLREALDLNPWLPERHFLTDLPGEDI